MSKELSEHKDCWIDLYNSEKDTIVKALRDNLIEIHHIGSTAVSGLIAKPQIDIVAAVDDLGKSINSLETLGFSYKGEFNIPFRYFFSKNTESQKVNLHVVRDKDSEMEGFLVFRNYMRTHPEAVEEYSQLKLFIEDKLIAAKKSPKKDIYLNEYTLSKDDFIRKILKQADFQGLCMRFVIHYNERHYEDKICAAHNYIIEPTDKRFVFYKGPELVGYANVSEDNTINIFDVNPEHREYFENRLMSYVKR